MRARAAEVKREAMLSSDVPAAGEVLWLGLSCWKRQSEPREQKPLL